MECNIITEGDYRLYMLLQEASTVLYDKDKNYRIMVCPSETRSLDVIWFIKGINFNSTTPIARIRMDKPEYAPINDRFVNPVWQLSEGEAADFVRLMESMSEGSQYTGFQRAIINQNIEKYGVFSEITFNLNKDYEIGKPLPFNMPMPDYRLLPVRI